MISNKLEGGGLHRALVAKVRRDKRDESRKSAGIDDGMPEPPVSDVLLSANFADPRVLKFWLLLVGGVVVFLVWLLLFSCCAKAWGPTKNHFDADGHNAAPSIMFNVADGTNNNDAVSSAGLFCFDVWFALGLMAAIDASAIVINFNRSLIHQFHYFVSLRMMLLAFIVSTAVLLLRGDTHPAAVFCLCCIFYMLSVFVLGKVHRIMLPVRGFGESRGSLQTFSKQMCQSDLPWKHAFILAATNGAVGLVLTALVPAKWSVLKPVVHITWEVALLGLVGTRKTPRYIWFATPLMQASTCTEWGLRQVVAAPRLVMAPWVFLAVMLSGRLMLDLHLRTVFYHRRDLQWARKEVLFPTSRLLTFLAGMLLVQDMGLPVVTFVKPIAVVIFHALGVLAFLLPASYALAFDKNGTIRS